MIEIRPADEQDGNDCVCCKPTIVEKAIVRPVGLHVVELSRDERGGVTFRLCPDHMMDLGERLGIAAWRIRPRSTTKDPA